MCCFARGRCRENVRVNVFVCSAGFAFDSSAPIVTKWAAWIVVLGKAVKGANGAAVCLLCLLNVNKRS